MQQSQVWILMELLPLVSTDSTISTLNSFYVSIVKNLAKNFLDVSLSAQPEVSPYFSKCDYSSNCHVVMADH